MYVYLYIYIYLFIYFNAYIKILTISYPPPATSRHLFQDSGSSPNRIQDVGLKLLVGFNWVVGPKPLLLDDYLVGGLEHFLFSHILGIIIPID